MFELTAPPGLPFDVIGYIIDVLFDDDKKGLQYVKNLSLVCHSFLPLCRQHIFKSCISIHMVEPRRNGKAFGRLLSKSPNIARYVHKLKIYTFYPFQSHTWRGYNRSPFCIWVVFIWPGAHFRPQPNVHSWIWCIFRHLPISIWNIYQISPYPISTPLPSNIFPSKISLL